MKEILPIGSVVTLNIMKEERKNTKFIIVKRFVTNPSNKTEYFEYELMLYPGGTKDGKSILVNSEQISNVIFKGFEDEEDEKFKQHAEMLLKENNLKKVDIQSHFA